MALELTGNIEVMATGFATVLVVLALLWGACAAVGRSFIQGRRKNLPVPTGGGEADTAISAHHLAVVAAAVGAVLEAPHRIVSVVAPAHVTVTWAQEGRFSHGSAPRASWDREALPTVARRGPRKIW